MLTGEFNIQLKNASSGTVVKNITLPAIITDFYKYESTAGFPFMERFSHSSSNSYDMGFCANTALVNSSGIKLFKETLDEDPKKITTNIDNEYCGFATRYNVNANAHQYSDKAGYMTDFVNDAIDFRKADGEKLKLSFAWHWDADKGNGVFKSIGTGHQGGVNCLDKDPLYTSTEVLSGSSVGYDFFPMCGMNIGSLSSPSSVSIMPNVSNENSMISAHGAINKSYINADHSFYDYYYQTDSNIIHLWCSDSVKDENDNYITKIKYKVINKKWLFKYTIGVREMNPLYVDHNAGATPDGEITINSGLYPLRLLTVSGYSPAASYMSKAIVEDSAYCVFFADAGEAHLNANPDGYNPNWAEARPQKCFIIRGDSPTLMVFDTNYDSLLTAINASRGSSDYSNLVPNYTLFLKDFSYITIYRGSSSEGYYNIIRRKLNNDEFIFKRNLGAIPSSYRSYNLCFFPGAAKNTFAFFRTFWSWGPGICTCQICNIADGSQVAYGLFGSDGNGQTYINDIVGWEFIDTIADSPYKLAFTSYSSFMGKFVSVLFTNFLYAKANLPEPITKTSDYTLDITFTLHIY